MGIFDRLFGKKKETLSKAKTEEDIEKMEDKGNVEGLILALRNRDPDLRKAAAQALCKVGNEQAVKPLIEALLKDDAWVVRRFAAEALGIIGGPQVVEPLTTALNNDSFVSDITGLAVVRLVAEKALERIEKTQTATEPLDRLLACQWSSPSPSKEVTELIEILTRNCESISDQHISKCLNAIEKLAKEKEPVVAEVMCYAALAAEHFKVRNSAADALKGIIKPELTQILCDALHYDREVYRPVAQALNALELIGDPSASSTIVGFLDDFRNTWSMKGDTIVSGMAAMVTLGAYSDKENYICLSACRTLAALGDSAAVTIIEAVLSDSYWSSSDEMREELPKLIAKMKR